jgi:2-polyprenyl-3-methyl-5-hydroxy-6-metoxy-1,4-benzoquinol methylase
MIGLPTRRSLRRSLHHLGGAARKHRARFRHIDEAARCRLQRIVRSWIPDPTDEDDLADETFGRLNDDRYTVISWLDAAIPLDGATVLEIGAGTGASTVALSEQGALVTGIDIDERSLAVARERCAIYGVSAELYCANVLDLPANILNRTFDLVIFFASLEHMTISERLAGMSLTWALVRPGGCWCVIETPNRLWFYDAHTSRLNFFHWLPDDLALAYAQRSQRKLFASDFSSPADNPSLKLARWGRGVSYHEFALSLGDVERLDVVSDQAAFLRRRNLAAFAYSLVSKARRYERFLARLEPTIHPAFSRQHLNLIIRKPE